MIRLLLNGNHLYQRTVVFALLCLWLLGSGFGLAGCITIKKPDKAKSVPSTINLMVYANDKVNSNLDNEPTPVNFVVIQMKNDLRLYTATFDEIVADLEEALKRDYISHEEYLVEPGKFVQIGPIELANKARFIAIVAAYRDSHQVIWRATQKVKAENNEYAMHAVFHLNGIKLDIEE